MQSVPGYRKALLFYLDHRDEMDEGIEMLDESSLPAHKFYWKWAGVGEAATLAVVRGIVGVIALDAVFAVVANAMGW